MILTGRKDYSEKYLCLTFFPFSSGESLVRDLRKRLGACLSKVTFSVLLSSSGNNVIHVGTTKRDSIDDGSIWTAVSERVNHPDFNSETFASDFVVLKLSAWVRRCSPTIASGFPLESDMLRVPIGR